MDHLLRTKDVSVPDMSKVWTVAVISNPIRYRTRYDLARKFLKHLEDSGMKNVVVVEAAFGNRNFEITDAKNPMHVQVRTYDEIWHKENMINLGFQRVSHIAPDAEKILWIDADVSFVNPRWALEAAEALEHYHVIQLFSHAQDLNPQFEVIQSHAGFMYMYHQNGCNPPNYGAGYGGYYVEGDGLQKTFWHPGFAWGARVEALNHLGGLMDFPILGSADHHMALALVGAADRSMPASISPAYKKHVKMWEDRSETFIQRDVGYIEGTLQITFSMARRRIENIKNVGRGYHY
jgi:hypothetical protein